MQKLLHSLIYCLVGIVAVAIFWLFSLAGCVIENYPTCGDDVMSQFFLGVAKTIAR